MEFVPESVGEVVQGLTGVRVRYTLYRSKMADCVITARKNRQRKFLEGNVIHKG